MKAALALVLLGSSASLSAQTCITTGPFTHCSDNTNYTRVGNTVIGPKGNYTRMGNTVFAPEGTYQRMGESMVAGPDGTYMRTGNMILSPHGTYTKVGNSWVGPEGTYSRVGSMTVAPPGRYSPVGLFAADHRDGNEVVRAWAELGAMSGASIAPVILPQEGSTAEAKSAGGRFDSPDGLLSCTRLGKTIACN